MINHPIYLDEETTKFLIRFVILTPKTFFYQSAVILIIRGRLLETILIILKPLQNTSFT